MTFSRYNPSGYADGDTIPAAFVNQLDQNLARALDGYAGGTYEPSAALVIGGSGIQIATSLVINSAGQLEIKASGSLYCNAGSAITVATGASLSVVTRANATATAYSRTEWINATTHGVSEDLYGAGTPEWKSGYLSGAVYWEQDAVGGNGYLYLPLTCVPTAASITTLAMHLQGAGSHVGLPATMPAISLVKQELDGSAITVVDTAVDPSASTTAYQAEHTVTLSGLSASPVSYAWMIRIAGEEGANSLVGLSVYSVGITWSTTSIGL